MVLKVTPASTPAPETSKNVVDIPAADIPDADIPDVTPRDQMGLKAELSKGMKRGRKRLRRGRSAKKLAKLKSRSCSPSSKSKKKKAVKVDDEAELDHEAEPDVPRKKARKSGDAADEPARLPGKRKARTAPDDDEPKRAAKSKASPKGKAKSSPKAKAKAKAKGKPSPKATSKVKAVPKPKGKPGRKPRNLEAADDEDPRGPVTWLVNKAGLVMGCSSCRFAWFGCAACKKASFRGRRRDQVTWAEIDGRKQKVAKSGKKFQNPKRSRADTKAAAARLKAKKGEKPTEPVLDDYDHEEGEEEEISGVSDADPECD